MSAQSLHPNLARLAAAYDNVIERYRRNEINAPQARREILNLVARDDNGVQWSVDPDNGKWRYRNIKGELVNSDPPSYGLATPTAHDLSRNPNAFNPDSQVSFQEVDESLLNPPGSLIGSTRRRPEKSKKMEPRKIAVMALVGVVAVLVGTAGYQMLNDDEIPLQPLPQDTNVSEQQ